MAIHGLRLDTTRPYESKYDPDRGTDKATVFTLGTLDSRTFGRIKDQATQFVVDPNAPNDEVRTSVNASEVNYQTVQYGLKGVKNLLDDDGNEIAFKTVKRRHGSIPYDIVHESVMNKIPQAVIEELAFEIARGNELDEVAAKN